MALTDEDKQWISQQLQRVETSLLTEFHKWDRADAGPWTWERRPIVAAAKFYAIGLSSHPSTVSERPTRKPDL
jgi:hypothetical protein